MHRRSFLAAAAIAAVPTCYALTAANKKFVFKIKTKSGSINDNVVIEASDAEAAKVKLRKRYPDCEILSMREK
jgi:hypothetical protein